MFCCETFQGGEEALTWCVVPLASVIQVDKVRVLEGALVPR